MRLKEAGQTNGWVKLAAAVIINAVFLAFTLTCFAPVYETNDDLFLSKFVDGQLSHRTIWMPYVNIVLACLIKVLYGAFGTGGGSAAGGVRDAFTSAGEGNCGFGGLAGGQECMAHRRRWMGI